MKLYMDLMQDILDNGEDRGDRTGVGTRSVFGRQVRYADIDRFFPLITTREIKFTNIVHELLWMLSGDTNIRYLVENGVHIWSEWPHKHYNACNPDRPLDIKQFNLHIREGRDFAEKWGDCGPVYGKQWRAWEGKPDAIYEDRIQSFSTVDQIAGLVHGLRTNPLSRRHIVSAWNVADIPAMIPSGLPPCHLLFQFYCRQIAQSARADAIRDRNDMMHFYDKECTRDAERDRFLDRAHAPRYQLDCHLNIRSNDMVLGHPYNAAQYALLTMMLAQQCDMVPGDLIVSIGDAHIYQNHREKFEHQLQRRPKVLPYVDIKKAADIFSYTIDDFTLCGYDAHPSISYPIAV